MNAVSMLAVVATIWLLLSVIAPEPPRRAIDALDRMRTRILALMLGILEQAMAHVAEVVERLGAELARARQGLEDGVCLIWQARTRAAKWIWAVVAGTVLFFPYLFSVFLDARAIEWGFEVAFGTPFADRRVPIAELFNDASAATTVVDGAGASLGHAPFLQPLIGMASRELGQMALGLAVLQGALGLFLFWRAGSDALGARFGVLLRERPIPLCTFLLVNATVAALAFVRGYAMTDGSYAGAALAAGVAAAMPCAMAYTLHFVLDALAAVVAALSTSAAIAALLAVGLVGAAALAVGAAGLAFGTAGVVVALGASATGALFAATFLRLLEWGADAVASVLGLARSHGRASAAVELVHPMYTVAPGERLMLEVRVPWWRRRGTVFEWTDSESEGRVISDPALPTAIYVAPEDVGVHMVRVRAIHPRRGTLFARAVPVHVQPARTEIH